LLQDSACLRRRSLFVRGPLGGLAEALQVTRPSDRRRKPDLERQEEAFTVGDAVRSMMKTLGYRGRGGC